MKAERWKSIQSNSEKLAGQGEEGSPGKRAGGGRHRGETNGTPRKRGPASSNQSRSFWWLSGSLRGGLW